MGRTSKKPLRTRERYILDSLETVFKGGEWVDEGPTVGNGLGNADRNRYQPAPENYEQPLYVTVIGGTKYDKDALSNYFCENPHAEIITGTSKGLESELDALVRIAPRPDYYLKGYKRFNVQEILLYEVSSPVLLVGTGQRVDQARSLIASLPYEREVVELP